MNQDFAVRAGEFEGPFETLLGMVEKKKLHISQVSLSGIADEYVSYVRANEFRLRDVSMFIWIAATLMLIKSRHLLPQFQVTDEEESDMQELTERLELYAIFKKQIEQIEQLFGKNKIFERIYRKKVVVSFRPDEQINLENIRLQMDDVFTTVEPELFVPQKKVVKQRSLKEITDHITRRIKQFMRVHFHELVEGFSKKEKAVSFLAVLELFKQGDVDLVQEEHFAHIMVHNREKQPD